MIFTPTLDKLERKLIRAVRVFSCARLLEAETKVRKNEDYAKAVTSEIFGPNNPGIQPFHIAAIASYAMRFSDADRAKTKSINVGDLATICGLFNDFLLRDPIGSKSPT